MTTDVNNPTPGITPPDITSVAPISPNQPNPNLPQPGQQGYDPMLDPKVRSWRDQYLQQLIAKDQTIKEAEAKHLAFEAEKITMAQKLAEFERKDRERAEAEMTEIQKYQTRTAEIERQHQEAQAQLANMNVLMAQKESEWQTKQRQMSDESELLATLSTKGIFPNIYEREGLKARLQKIEYTREEDRGQKITGIIDTYITETQRQTTLTPHNEVIPNQPAGLRTIAVPPGGAPTTAAKLLEDNYSDLELRQLSKSDPEKFRQIAQQRADLAAARGVMMIKMKYS